MSPLPNIIERILEYAEKTKIDFHATSRHDWTVWGLPPLRGFNPHLRRVNLYAGKFKENLWLLHDVLHIAFYDFAALNLGADAWNSDERFLENHLASELFSVLLLDYHYLVSTKFHGLAVDLDSEIWPQFQQIKRDLPSINSFNFCKALFDLYFTGESLLHDENLISKEYKNWIGHEVRYSTKQRIYISQWLSDLKCKKENLRETRLEGSEVVYGVWDLIQIFKNSTDRQWKNYLKEIKSKPINYFKNFPKYKNKTTNFDFRFTDISAVKIDKLIDEVEKSKKPSSSSLFLFWQILSQLSPQKFDSRTKSEIQELAELANVGRPPQDLWNKVRQIVSGTIRWQKFPHGPLQKETVSTFFLP